MTKETEWLDEPNKLEWEHEGYQCTIIRNSKYGYLCGYVELQGDHPWHGRNVYSFYDIDVHGGITFSNDYLPIVTKNPYKQYCNLWWLGFDASHYDEDIYPWGYKYDSIITTATYKNIEFMKAECEKLVRLCQVAEIKKKNEEKRKDFFGDPFKILQKAIKKEVDCYEETRPIRQIMLQIINRGYDAIDTYNRGSGVRPTDDNMKLIQANNMLIDMAKWGKFRTAEKKHYTCECKYKESSDDEPIKIIEIGVCPNKDPENIRLCKLSTKIWDKLLNSMEDRRTFKNAWYEISDNYEDMAHYCEINTELRAIVFKTLVEESLKRD